MEDEDKLTNRLFPGLLSRPDFAPMSVGALQDYIAGLKAEISRAESAIQQKTAARGHADSFFKPL
jgi:uncharacterized small protein (DUF1192 family)